MPTLFVIVCYLFLVMETLVGMVANGSIVYINFLDWFRSRKLSPADRILISLGFSRLLLQAIVILHAPLQSSALNDIPFTLMGMWIFTNNVNLWFAACLSVLYLAKIAIFSHPVFLQVKRRFPGLVPWLLLGSVIASAAKSIIVTTSWKYGLPTCNSHIFLLSNKSNAESNLLHVCGVITALIAVYDFIPFMVFLSSSILLLTSLWKHLRRVQHNGTGARDLNTQVHLSAIRALAAFAVLYMISFVVLTSVSVLDRIRELIWSTVLLSVSAMYPSGHAVILILINPKLKQAWVRMLHHLKCHFTKVPS